VRLDVPSFDGLIKIVRPTNAKRNTKMRETVTVCQLSAIKLRCLATGIAVEDL